MKKKNKKKWLKFRHKVVRSLAYWALYPYSMLKYGIKIDKFKEQGKRAYLILFNHQTAFDQFFVGCSFKGPVYYVASEDLFSKGWVSALIRFIVAPIPIKKQSTDVSAVMNCIRVAKEGGTIAMAPEGNRTYSGATGYMNPAIAPLARKLKLPIAIYRIEGGYGVHPRWSDVVRKGKMHSYVSRVIEPEEIASLNNEQLYELIQKELYVNEGIADACFVSDKKAEYLERAMYVCPDCGLSEFYSNANEIECKKCRKKIEYREDKSLRGVGFDFQFNFVKDWYDYQCDFINKLDVMQYTDTPVYRDTASVSQIFVYKGREQLFENAQLDLYGDKFVVTAPDGTIINMSFDDISAVSVLGRNKLNVYYKDKLYQFKSDKRFNALKYVNIYFRYKNKGDENNDFLGI